MDSIGWWQSCCTPEVWCCLFWSSVNSGNRRPEITLRDHWQKSLPDRMDLPHQLLLQIILDIEVALTTLINNCILLAVYPENLKNATVIPITKYQQSISVDNFWRISLISNLSKVFERIVQKEILYHLKTHNLLSNQQSGFRNGHSCET